MSEKRMMEIAGLNEGKVHEMVVAYESLEDIQTMMDLPFADAMEMLEEIDAGSARKFAQGMSMMTKAVNTMMTAIKKYS